MTKFYTRLVLLLCTIYVPQAAIAQSDEEYPQATSKKGLQVELVDDALELGIKHAALNIDLCRLVDVEFQETTARWEMNGVQYSFRQDYLKSLDDRIKVISGQGVLINVILLTYLSPNPHVNAIMIHPNCDANAPNRLGAFNTVSDEGKNWLRATLQFLANRWSREDRHFGRVVGWIVGNEVNSHWWWSNMGRVTMQEFATEYLKAVRIVHDAVTSQALHDRVYISLEHHWGIRYAAGDESQSFPAKDFLTHFAQQAREGGDFAWHLAFHPYPENLFEPRFWNDTSATDSIDSPRITFKNIDVLPRAMKQSELLYQGQTRRIILSEQGFHTPDTEDGEIVQAAAYCYAYKKVEAITEIDAFILHRHVDHPHEGGLMLGLRKFKPSGNEARPKKRIYNCFKLADTPQWEEAFKFALPIVGLDSWDEAIK